MLVGKAIIFLTIIFTKRIISTYDRVSIMYPASLPTYSGRGFSCCNPEDKHKKKMRGWMDIPNVTCQ